MKQSKKAAKQRAEKGGGSAQAAKNLVAPVTCNLKYGLPATIVIDGVNFYRVKPGESSGSFVNGFNDFVYYVSKSGTTAQQRINATYAYPHLSVQFDRQSQEVLSAHWTPLERSTDDSSNPHVRWDNGPFGFIRNNAMTWEEWDVAVAAKNSLRKALRGNFGMNQLRDEDPT